MKIGYSAWGFVGDGVLDSPDGGRLTRALLLANLIANGHEIIWLQQNRDVDQDGNFLFTSDRVYPADAQKNYLCQIQYASEGYPEIDALFLEWRWRLPGRNCDVDKSSKEYTPDLDRQTELLNCYLTTDAKIIIWDKDETLSQEDEDGFIKAGGANIQILSPALYPKSHFFERQTLLFPCDLKLIKGTKVNNHTRYMIGYVGSQYERDYQVYKYINPFSFKYPNQAVFAGNWTKYPERAERNGANFPCITFLDRILPKNMWKVYNECVTSVLLCKSNYAEHGHITQRIHEVASNGVIAIGLAEQKGIEQFVVERNVVKDAYDLINCVEYLQALSIEKRQEILDEQIERLEPFDINNVIAKLESILCV